MIRNKFIHFKTKQNFEEKLDEIQDESIVFIKDSQEIYTHGLFYGNKTLSDDYIISPEENQDLNPQSGDDFETVTSKLHKSIITNEEVVATTVNKLKDEIGLTDNLDYSPTSDNLLNKTIIEAIDNVNDRLIAAETEISDNLPITKSAIDNLKINADKLQGYDSSKFVLANVSWNANTNDKTGIYKTYTNNSDLPSTNNGNLVIHMIWDDNACNDLFFRYDIDYLAYRRKQNGIVKPWRQIAFVDSDITGTWQGLNPDLLYKKGWVAIPSNYTDTSDHTPYWMRMFKINNIPGGSFTIDFKIQSDCNYPLTAYYRLCGSTFYQQSTSISLSLFNSCDSYHNISSHIKQGLEVLIDEELYIWVKIKTLWNQRNIYRIEDASNSNIIKACSDIIKQLEQPSGSNPIVNSGCVKQLYSVNPILYSYYDSYINMKSAGLYKPVSLWGNSFDGTESIFGNLTVGSTSNNKTQIALRSSSQYACFNVDDKYGIYDLSRNKWLISCDGTNTWLDQGNVRIGATGTTNSEKLYVAGNAAVEHGLKVVSSTNEAHINLQRTTGPGYIKSANAINFITNNRDCTNETAAVIITTDNKVGIGTRTPTEQLEVVNSIKATAYKFGNATISYNVNEHCIEFNFI